MNNIINGNILLAKFLGHTYIGGEFLGDEYYNHCITSSNGIVTELPAYHEDWNCLMEVVQKIEKQGHLVTITYHSCKIETEDKAILICKTNSYSTISAVHEACIKLTIHYIKVPEIPHDTANIAIEFGTWLVNNASTMHYTPNGKWYYDDGTDKGIEMTTSEIWNIFCNKNLF